MATDRWMRQACLALLLFVAGARLATVSWAGIHLPVWDQWFAEFGVVIAPLAEGRLRFLDLAASQNEHWVLYPRLITTGLALASGRWEPLDEAIVSAILRALALAGVFLILSRGQSAGTRAVLLLLLGLMGALPLGVFNLLSGYQVQFFFGEVLSVAALALLCGGPLTVERLALGSACLILALLNMASPFITAAAAAVVIALRSLTTSDRRGNASAALFLLIFAGAVFWTTPRTVWMMIGARSAAEFVWTLLKLWAWPFPEAPLLGLLSGVPGFLLLRRLVRDRELRDSGWFVLALSVSSLVQDAAIAYARAQSGTSFPQYRDGLWLRNVVGFLALTEALRPSPGDAPGRPPARGAVAWALGVAALMLIDAGVRGAPEIAAIRTAAVERQPRLARSLATGDFRELDAEIAAILSSGSLRFFDHPSGRFAVPPRVIADLKEKRETVLPRFPAALTGADPATLSKGLRALASLGLLFVLWGSGLIAGCLRSALRASAPETART